MGGDRKGVLSMEGRQPAGVLFQGSCLRNAVALVPTVARTRVEGHLGRCWWEIRDRICVGLVARPGR